jgi:hypothetical protein
MQGEFILTAGTQLKILVGQTARLIGQVPMVSMMLVLAAVVHLLPLSDDTPLIVAGGGGGAGLNSGWSTGYDGA